MKKAKAKKTYIARVYPCGDTLAKATANAKSEAGYGSKVTVFELVPVATYSASIKEVKHK